MKFMLANKGAISIFLLIILLPVMVLSSVLIDGSRKLAADMIAEEAADSAAMSVLADFNGALKTDFGVFALNDSTAVNDTFKKYLASTLMVSGINDPAYTEFAYNYLKAMLVGDSKFKAAKFLNFYDFRINNTRVDPIYSLAKPEVLENQIIEYMKYRAPLEMVKKSNFLTIIEGVKQINEVQESAEILAKKNNYDKQLYNLQALCLEAKRLVEQVNKQFDASNLTDIIDKAEAILKKTDDVSTQATTLINEMDSKKSAPGMVGEVAAQIIYECENSLKELNKAQINQLITDAEVKKTANPDVGKPIKFANPYTFGAAKGVGGEDSKNYRTANKPEAGKGVVDKQPSKNIDVKNAYPKYSTLPSQLKQLAEPNLKVLSELDKAYVGSMLDDLADSADDSLGLSEKDMSAVLNSIDFVEEDNVSWNNSVFDVVLDGGSWIFDGVKGFFEDIRDDVLIVEYAAGIFKSRLTVKDLPTPSGEAMKKQYIVNWRYQTDVNHNFEGEHDLRGLPKLSRKTMFENAELEYIVAGNSSENWNKNQVYSQIFSLRLMNNLIAVYGDTERNNACLAAAAAASAALGGIGTPVLHWSFMLALASAETIRDMNFLVEKGYKIPLIKTGSNFQLSLDLINPANLGSEPKFSPKDILVCYEDYLKILMIMLVDKETRIKRIGDLIQLNMYSMGKTDFEMQKAYTLIRAESKSTINYLFLPVVAKSYFNKPSGAMQKHTIIYQGY